MRTIIIYAFLLVTFFGMTVSAFDGKRKGFVLGGGFGPALSHKIDPELIFSDERGWAANLIVGYAWDEQNMIVYEDNGALFYADNHPYFVGPDLIVHGISAITWYHYWGPTGRSLFTAAGLGLYSYNVRITSEYTRKSGWLLGVGYEFKRHWQAGLYLSKGKTRSYIDFELTTVSLLIGGVAF